MTLEERNQLVIAYTDLVRSIARKMRPKFLVVDYEDLVQYGYLGLIRAANAYDPERFDHSFGTYAAKWIAGAIITGLHQDDLVQRPPKPPVKFVPIKFERPSREPSPFDEAIRKEANRFLRRIEFTQLTDIQRDAIFWVFYADMDTDSLHEGLGISKRHIREISMIARRKMYRRLREFGIYSTSHVLNC